MSDLHNDFLKGEFRTIGQFFTYLSMAFGKSPSNPIHIFIIHPVDNASIEKIKSSSSNRGIVFKYKEVCRDLYKISIRISVREVNGYLFAQNGWWMIVSQGSGYVINDVIVKSFVKSHFFPILAPAHVPSSNLFEIVDDLKCIYDDVILDEFSMASERGSLREWLKSGEKITENLRDKLQSRYNSSFTAFRVTALANNSIPLKFRIYSESRLCFLSGSFGDFYQFVIIPYVRKSLYLMRTYEERQRRVHKGKLLMHGVRVQGRESLSKEDIQSIKSFISKNYSTILLHENPIIILQASDKKDGSSYDIYISQKSINIVPLTKASSGSLIALFTSIIRRLPPFMTFEPIRPLETDL